TGGSTFTVTGTFSATGGGTALLATGQLDIGTGGATFDFPSGAFQWKGGAIDLAGNTLTNTGSLTLSNSLLLAAPSDAQGTLANAGMIVEQAGTPQVRDAIVLDNQVGATYRFAADSGIASGAYGSTVINAGTIEKAGGTGTSQITSTLNNTGTIRVDTGGLTL